MRLHHCKLNTRVNRCRIGYLYDFSLCISDPVSLWRGHAAGDYQRARHSILDIANKRATSWMTEMGRNNAESFTPAKFLD
jgi:hypothetical protein